MQKKDIIDILDRLTLPGEGQSISQSGAITNINIFGQEVIIDLTMKTPALHIKKRVVRILPRRCKTLLVLKLLQRLILKFLQLRHKGRS